MNWIYLSPHPDDVALSCGGLVWEQTHAGEMVSIWTICAGNPPDGPLSPFAEVLHARWGTGREAFERRRQEDIASCRALSASYRHFSIPDCIYRLGQGVGGAPEHLYASEQALFGPLHPAEASLRQWISEELAQALPLDAQLVCPLTLGNHVDHQLTRLAAEDLGRDLWFYADYPYVQRQLDYGEQLTKDGWRSTSFPVSREGMAAWLCSVAAHGSQFSTFWPNLEAAEQEIQGYCEKFGGILLWQGKKDR